MTASPSSNLQTSQKQASQLAKPCPFSLKTQKIVMIGSVINAVVIVIAYGVYLYFRLSVPSDIIYTKLGPVQGTIELSRNGNSYSQYLGIPYALPPTGNRRFEPPESALPWEGIRDASYFRPFCLQLESFVTGFVLGKEDCLYLNVYVPKNGEASDKNVMVYIHGGIFHVGGSDFAGAKYFMDEDIILVTLNYRLGALGFLSTGDEVISGNMGLKDQNMALRWIKDNIQYFGGNPNKVCIFGESAGGASVHHQLLSPASKGLFNKVIHQSGSSINYWGTFRNVKKQSIRFAKKFGCPTSTSAEIATCLKNLDGSTLVTAHRELMDLLYRSQITTFVPTIESPKAKSPFLTEEPKKLLETGRFNRIPVMAGIHSNEGQLISKTITANQTKLNEANDFYKWAPLTLHYSEELRNVSSKLHKFYFGGAKTINSTDYSQSFTDILGDRLFIVRTAVAGRMESKFVPTYMYYYDYRGSFNTGELISHAQGDFLPNWLNVGIYVSKEWLLRFFNLVPKRIGGACHGDEIMMLFNRDFFHYISHSHPDYSMSADLVKLWASFAKDEPTIRFRDVEWLPNTPSSKSSDFKYLRISENPSMIQEPFEERRLLWESLNLPES